MSDLLRMIGVIAIVGIVAAVSRAAEVEKKHQTSEKQVVVEGRAAIVDGNEARARERAIHDALRMAVEQVVGVYVSSKTKVENLVVIRDEILTKADGYAALDEVVSEKAVGGNYIVKAKVTVFLTKAPEEKTGLLRKLKALGLLREWRVMVIIPETHIRRPNIPDPAAETEIIRQFVKAGFKVVDQKRIKEIRDSEAVQRILDGDIEAARKLGQRFGADIVITGEAFSQFVTRVPVGEAELIVCRGRVEARAIRVDTGEIIAADGVQDSGRDATEELASKVCLKNVAAKLAPLFIDDILVLPASLTRHIEIVIRGWKKRSDATKFEDALRQIPGVRKVTHTEFTASTNYCEVEIDADEAKRLSAYLEEHELMKPFGITVEDDSAGKIVGKVKDTG